MNFEEYVKKEKEMRDATPIRLIKRLKEYIDFSSLPIGTKVHIITRGEIRHYKWEGTSKINNNYLLFRSTSNENDVLNYRFDTISDSIKTDDFVICINYESKQIGEIMIKQLEKRIQSVKKIYLK